MLQRVTVQDEVPCTFYCDVLLKSLRRHGRTFTTKIVFSDEANSYLSELVNRRDFRIFGSKILHAVMKATR